MVVKNSEGTRSGGDASHSMGAVMGKAFGKLFLVCAVAALAAISMSAQKQPKGQSALRDVQGIVSDESGKPVPGAVVQLKNTKTLQVISFIAKEQGDYYFHGLSPDIDFELTAQQGNKVSATRTLSTFDTRKQSVMNLKLDREKK